MEIRFVKAAQAEVDDAVIWYESQLRGLGIKFLDDFDRAIRQIATYPLAYSEIGNGLHRCLLTKFPYGVIYGIDAESIIVVAVAHLHREPRYWTDRARS